jgi:hypothetical protein
MVDSAADKELGFSSSASKDQESQAFMPKHTTTSSKVILKTIKGQVNKEEVKKFC